MDIKNHTAPCVCCYTTVTTGESWEFYWRAGGCGAAVSKNPPTLHVLEAPDRLNEWTNEETLMLEKQAIIDKLQSSVSTYVRCGGVVKIF